MQGDRKGLPYRSRRCQMEGRPLRSPCPLQTVISSRLKIGRLLQAIHTFLKNLLLKANEGGPPISFCRFRLCAFPNGKFDEE